MNKAFTALQAALALLYMAIWGVIFYAIYHFVMKYW